VIRESFHNVEVMMDHDRADGHPSLTFVPKHRPCIQSSGRGPGPESDHFHGFPLTNGTQGELAHGCHICVPRKWKAFVVYLWDQQTNSGKILTLPRHALLSTQSGGSDDLKTS
jgi:hypothetical protein